MTDEPINDAEALDKLAAYLRDVPDWNGGDFCELAADMISRTGRSLDTEFQFVPNYDVKAATEEEAFAIFMDAIEKDVAHYREFGITQIEYRTLAEILAQHKGDA